MRKSLCLIYVLGLVFTVFYCLATKTICLFLRALSLALKTKLLLTLLSQGFFILSNSSIIFSCTEN
ncbi:MAG: hypothetical protein JWR18_4213 [Segetibacter sp.]|jgi:hypothetical protein|nr:hypothetical protein [Segetibacter sp.]